MDFSKAFDTVNHQTLINKLASEFDMSNSACTLLLRYLRGRSQFVTQPFDTSVTGQIFRGVPQGSVLGPLLFSLYINDLPNHINHSKCHMYADDVQILASGSALDGPNIINRINEDLNNVNNWAIMHDLKINALKSSALIISRNGNYKDLWQPVNINGSVIPYNSCAKNLGIWFDDRMNWKHHISLLCGKIYSSKNCLGSSTYNQTQIS